MPGKLSATAIAVIFTVGLTTSLAAQTQTSAPQQHPGAAAVQPQTKIPEVPPEMARRIQALQSAMQPSAKAWVEQQAKLESQKQTPDAPSIEAAVYNRFPALNTRGSSVKASDINALVAIVLMESAKDAQTDLQKMMTQMQAINNAKQQLRNLYSQVQLEIKSNATLVGTTMCTTALCKSLADTLNQITVATINLQKPVRILLPAKPTYADLRDLSDQLKSNLDSMNELSETQSLRLQMAMDRYSKLIETLSNIMKKIDDTSSSVIQNIK